MLDELTYIHDADVYVCDNCGAFNAHPYKIEHHKGCKKGEAKKWEKFYSENKEPEDAPW